MFAYLLSAGYEKRLLALNNQKKAFVDLNSTFWGDYADEALGSCLSGECADCALARETLFKRSHHRYFLTLYSTTTKHRLF